MVLHYVSGFFIFKRLFLDSGKQKLSEASLKDDWNARCETPGGSAGQVRLLIALCAKRLTARPPESEHPGVEIIYLLNLTLDWTNIKKKLIN
jgi:hypothetical protein